MDQFFPQLKMEAVPTEIGILVVLLAATVVVYFQIPKSGTSSNNNDKATNHRDLLDSSRPKPQNPKVNVSQAAPKPINDVWEERRKRGIAHAPTVVKQDSQETKKPFGSSYYYAHNSTKNKGGYSDGLKMEDFTMNGPRLLSKGGNSNGVAAATPTISGDGSSAGGAGAGNDQGNDINSERESESDPISVTNPQRSQQQEADIGAASYTTTSSSQSPVIFFKDITRYLWDDPGDASGIGTIRIDTLPGPTSSTTMDWKDAKIQTVSATLIEGNNGLLVIAKDENNNPYRLQIKRLYDAVTEVRTVVKPKRLLVKLYKKKQRPIFGGTTTLEAWPHPQKKHAD